MVRKNMSIGYHNILYSKIPGIHTFNYEPMFHCVFFLMSGLL